MSKKDNKKINCFDSKISNLFKNYFIPSKPGERI